MTQNTRCLSKTSVISRSLLVALTVALACAVLLGLPAAGQTASAAKAAFDLSLWQSLLEKHVNESGWVDYDGMARDHQALDLFISAIARTHVPSWSNHDDELAFWINTYNAYTVAAALEHINTKAAGVKEVPGFFDREKHLVAGEQLTLDEIERKGRALKDPRIHFAIVCASTSCPKLQRFAYRGDILDHQLSEAARQFVGDPTRGLRPDLANKRVYLSSIFKWYAGDFTGNEGATGQWLARAGATLSGQRELDFAKRYLPEEMAREIEKRNPDVSFLDYDWTWNSQKNHPRPMVR